jgi:hypothetical protein
MRRRDGQEKRRGSVEIKKRRQRGCISALWAVVKEDVGTVRVKLCLVGTVRVKLCLVVRVKLCLVTFHADEHCGTESV